MECPFHLSPVPKHRVGVFDRWRSDGLAANSAAHVINTALVHLRVRYTS